MIAGSQAFLPCFVSFSEHKLELNSKQSIHEKKIVLIWDAQLVTLIPLNQCMGCYFHNFFCICTANAIWAMMPHKAMIMVYFSDY